MRMHTKIQNSVVIFSVCVVLAILLRPLVSFGQTTTEAVASSSVNEQSVQTAPQETKAPLVQKVLLKSEQTRIINLCANISNIFDATLFRLENIATRLETRMKIMDEAGFDVTLASAELTATRQTLTQVHAKLTTVDTAVTAAVTSEKPQTAWVPVRATFAQTHQQLLSAQQQLTTAVQILRGSTVTQTTVVASTTKDSSI